MSAKNIICFCRLLTILLVSVQVLPLKAYAAKEPEYDIQATINTETKTITASQKVTVTNSTADTWNEIYFHIYANRKYSLKERKFLLRYASYFKVNPFPDGFQEGKVDIQSVSQDDQKAAFQIEGEDQTLLKVVLLKPLAPGGSAQIDLQIAVKIPHTYGRFAWHENITTLSRWYPILSVYGKSGWTKYPFYPFHRPFYSEAARYKVDLTIPSNQVLIHSGEAVSETQLDSGWKRITIDSQLPIREFSLVLSPDYKVEEGNFKDTKLRIYYLPGTENHSGKALKIVQDLMKYYSERFGPYPYKTFSIAPVYLGYGGEQMSNLAYIDTRVFKLPQILDRYFDFLIAHETGHQWIYNLVGMDEYSEMWLEEGVHSYFILQYMKEKYGEKAEVLDFPDWFENYKWILPELTFDHTRDVRYKIISRIGLDSPVVSELSSFQEPSSIFSLTYGKGSDIVEMLHYLIGEEAFERIFNRIFRDYRHKILKVEDFVRISEEESGQALSWFFKEWLYTKNRYDVAVEGVSANRVVLSNKGGIEMPVEVMVNYADGDSYDFLWDTMMKTESVAIKERKKIRNVEVDPLEKTLDLDRTNNHWPRKVNVKLVPLYLGLYDIPILMPDDAYNFIFGPEVNNGPGIKASFQKPYDYNLYTGTDYEFGEQIHHTRLGYQINNIFHKPMAFGFEIANQTDYKDGDDDLVSEKVFLRRELWPIPYGVGTINDHISLYMIRNQGLSSTLISGGTEDTRNLSYLKRDEAIIGINLHLERSNVSPDPSTGYKVNAAVENSGHFFGATQYFNRANIDTTIYQPVTLKSKLALRLKYGWGSPEDKNLYQLGGWEGLRGYDRKEVRGSNAFLGSLEYRFPIHSRLNLSFFDNIIGFESLAGVAFVDAGQSWYDDFDASYLRKDAGMGLRLTMNIGSFLERIVIRADVAQAINENRNDPHLWFGVGHAF